MINYVLIFFFKVDILMKIKRVDSFFEVIKEKLSMKQSMCDFFCNYNYTKLCIIF